MRIKMTVKEKTIKYELCVTVPEECINLEGVAQRIRWAFEQIKSVRKEDITLSGLFLIEEGEVQEIIK
jgi:hypothetical protein